MSTIPLHLAAALDGAGSHSAARREPGARPDDLCAPGYWADLARIAERGLLDLVTFEDSGHGPVPSEWPHDRLDAQLIAEACAEPTSRIGLVPTVTATRTESLGIASDLAALDQDSLGRTGATVRPPVRHDVGHPWPGRSTTPVAKALAVERLREAADTVDAVRRFWGRWDGEAFRDPATHGRLPILIPGDGWETFRLAARAADVVLTTPHDAFGAAMIAELVREAERDVGREGEPLRVFADLVVLLDDSVEAARDRLDRMDAVDPLYSDVAVVATTASGLADMMLAWQPAGIDGYRLHPARLPADLERISEELVPELRRRGAFRTAYDEPTLGARFGLERPASRFASVS